jgi:hypothetical protein
MGFNDFVWSIFQGVKQAKEQDPYRQLEKSWWLYDVSELRELADKAKTKQQQEIVLDHLYKWDATRVDYYKNIENKIIDRMWE